MIEGSGSVPLIKGFHIEACKVSPEARNSLWKPKNKNIQCFIRNLFIFQLYICWIFGQKIIRRRIRIRVQWILIANWLLWYWSVESCTLFCLKNSRNNNSLTVKVAAILFLFWWKCVSFRFLKYFSALRHKRWKGVGKLAEKSFHYLLAEHCHVWTDEGNTAGTYDFAFIDADKVGSDILQKYSVFVKWKLNGQKF